MRAGVLAAGYARVRMCIQGHQVILKNADSTENLIENTLVPEQFKGHFSYSPDICAFRSTLANYCTIHR